MSCICGKTLSCLISLKKPIPTLPLATKVFSFQWKSKNKVFNPLFVSGRLGRSRERYTTFQMAVPPNIRTAKTSQTFHSTTQTWVSMPNGTSSPHYIARSHVTVWAAHLTLARTWGDATPRLFSRLHAIFFGIDV